MMLQAIIAQNDIHLRMSGTQLLGCPHPVGMHEYGHVQGVVDQPGLIAYGIRSGGLGHISRLDTDPGTVAPADHAHSASVIGKSPRQSDQHRSFARATHGQIADDDHRATIPQANCTPRSSRSPLPCDHTRNERKRSEQPTA